VEQIWSIVLATDQITPETNFFDAGGHSISAMRMVASLQAALKTAVPVGTLYKAPRFRDFVQEIESRNTDPVSSRIIRIQPSGPRTPLIMFNNAWNMFPLSRSLEPDRPLISIQFVDRTTTMPKGAVKFDAVIDEAVGLIRAAQPHGPYNLA